MQTSASVSVATPTPSTIESISTDFTSIPTSFLSSITGTIDSTSTSTPSPSTTNSTSTMSLSPSSSSSISPAIDEAQLKLLYEKIKQRNWVATLRSPPSFFSPTLFSRPRNFSEATTRFELNGYYYLTNYIGLCALILLCAVLSTPSFLFTLLLLICLWIYVLQTETVKIGNSINLNGKQKLITFSIISGIVLFLFNGGTIFTVVGLSGSVVVAHAIMHQLPTEQEQEQATQQELTNLV